MNDWWWGGGRGVSIGILEKEVKIPNVDEHAAGVAAIMEVG